MSIMCPFGPKPPSVLLTESNISPVSGWQFQHTVPFLIIETLNRLLSLTASSLMSQPVKQQQSPLKLPVDLGPVKGNGAPIITDPHLSHQRSVCALKDGAFMLSRVKRLQVCVGITIPRYTRYQLGVFGTCWSESRSCHVYIKKNDKFFKDSRIAGKWGVPKPLLCLTSCQITAHPRLNNGIGKNLFCCLPAFHLC